MKTSLRLWLTFVGIAAAMLPAAAQNSAAPAEAAVRRMVFDGVKSEQKFALKDLDAGMPSDWSPYSYLVMEMRTTSPQRFGLWANTANGPRRIEMQQPFRQVHRVLPFLARLRLSQWDCHRRSSSRHR